MAGANVPTLKELPSMVQHHIVAPEDTGVWFSGTELAGVTSRPWAPFSAFSLTPKMDGSCHLKVLILEWGLAYVCHMPHC